MAEGKRGFLQGILQSIPVIGAKKPEEGLPAKGPLPVHTPKVSPYSTGMGWYPHRIKYRGMFDLDKLYKVMALWFKERRFELHERLYKSKPPELEVRLEAERKRTNFARELIFVHMHMWGDYNIEVIVNGKKKKMAKVRMVITIRGDIEAPYADIFGEPRWTATNLERRLLNIFKGWIMRREMEGLYWDRLYYEMYDLYGRIKETLQFGAR
ncbi:hypothetical protein HYU20_04205 [Candidatus Woesearchaeota archaeon]|nr:hypothetical protein [Candidatus Woesearchaeota archaeon]